jgi:hypothetical protein
MSQSAIPRLRQPPSLALAGYALAQSTCPQLHFGPEHTAVTTTHRRWNPTEGTGTASGDLDWGQRQGPGVPR